MTEGNTSEMNQEILREVKSELNQLRADYDREIARRDSATNRVFEILQRITGLITLAIVGWVWGLGLDVTENKTQLREYSATRFSAQDGLSLEARMIARENPQIALLIQEMRALTISIAERMTRVETQIQAIRETPR